MRERVEILVVNRFCKRSLNDHFVSFFNRFQKRSFRFRKKTILSKNDPLVLNFKKTNNDRF